MAGQEVSRQPSTFVNRECRSCPSGKFSTRNNVNSCTAFRRCPRKPHVPAHPYNVLLSAVSAGVDPCRGQTPSLLPGNTFRSGGSRTKDRDCPACPNGQYSSENAARCCPDNVPYAILGALCARSPCSVGQEVSLANPTQCIDINEVRGTGMEQQAVSARSQRGGGTASTTAQLSSVSSKAAANTACDCCPPTPTQCTRGTHTCSSSATCRNTIGSFKCACAPSFAFDLPGNPTEITNRASGFVANAQCLRQAVSREVRRSGHPLCFFA